MNKFIFDARLPIGYLKYVLSRHESDLTESDYIGFLEAYVEMVISKHVCSTNKSKEEKEFFQTLMYYETQQSVNQIIEHLNQNFGFQIPRNMGTLLNRETHLFHASININHELTITVERNLDYNPFMEEIGRTIEDGGWVNPDLRRQYDDYIESKSNFRYRYY